MERWGKSEKEKRAPETQSLSTLQTGIKIKIFRFSWRILSKQYSQVTSQISSDVLVKNFQAFNGFQTHRLRQGRQHVLILKPSKAWRFSPVNQNLLSFLPRNFLGGWYNNSFSLRTSENCTVVCWAQETTKRIHSSLFRLHFCVYFEDAATVNWFKINVRFYLVYFQPYDDWEQVICLPLQMTLIEHWNRHTLAPLCVCVRHWE